MTIPSDPAPGSNCNCWFTECAYHDALVAIEDADPVVAASLIVAAGAQEYALCPSLEPDEDQDLKPGDAMQFAAQHNFRDPVAVARMLEGLDLLLGVFWPARCKRDTAWREMERKRASRLA